MKANLYNFQGSLVSSLRPNWDPEILEEVYKKYNTGLLILAYMAVIGQTYFSLYDFSMGHPYNASLRVISLLICALYIYFFKRLDSGSKIDWHLLVIVSFYLCEVEVELYSFDDPYYHLSTWLMIPLLMMYHAFYFKNTPQYYVLFWFLLLVYYYVRAALSPVATFSSPELLQVVLYLIPCFLVSSIFNFLWTQNRYTNQLYLRTLERETIRRIEIEKELAIQTAKENMIDDLHDHLGSAILDMKWKILEILNEFPQNSESREKIQHSLYQIEDALRLNINSVSDLKYISEDFAAGIRAILFRRYEIYKRQTRMIFVPVDFPEIRDPELLREFYLLFMNICSIDLKIGKGISSWNCTYDGGFSLDFQSTYRLKQEEHPGKWKDIQEFVESVKGIYSNHTDPVSFGCKIVFPFKSL